MVDVCTFFSFCYVPDIVPKFREKRDKAKEESKKQMS